MTITIGLFILVTMLVLALLWMVIYHHQRMTQIATSLQADIQSSERKVRDLETRVTNYIHELDAQATATVHAAIDAVRKSV